MAEDTTTEKAPERVPSAHERYLDSLAESRANEGNTAEENLKAQEEAAAATPYAVEGNETDAFVGVSPEYRTYSGEFGKPYRTDEGPTADAEQEAEERQLPLQTPANPVHPSEAKATPVATAREAGEEAGKESSESQTQLPPVPAEQKAPAHKAAAKPNDKN